MKLKIFIKGTDAFYEANSKSEMWKTVKKLFDKHGDESQIVVMDENDIKIKDLSIRITSTGKKWMTNSISSDNLNDEDCVIKKNKKRGIIIAA